MKLSEKGKFAPAPRLPASAQRVADAVAAWEGVGARTHWLLGDEREVDGADFHLGEDELGHIHLDGEAHVMLTPSLAHALIDARLGQAFEWSRSVVVFPIESRKDVEHATWLFGVSYDRRRGASAKELLARVHDYVRSARAS